MTGHTSDIPVMMYSKIYVPAMAYQIDLLCINWEFYNLPILYRVVRMTLCPLQL